MLLAAFSTRIFLGKKFFFRLLQKNGFSARERGLDSMVSEPTQN